MIWNFVWPAPHPKYMHPTGTLTHFFHLRVNAGFWQKFFKTPCVPHGCIYRSNFLGREQQVPEVSFDAILSQKFFLKILPLNPKGKVALGSFWDQFSSAKTTFLTWYETSSKHHRRWLKVQRTRLKPFLTSEGHLGRTKSRGRLFRKSGFFGRNFSSGCAYVCKYFLVGCAGRRGPKGPYLRGKSCPTSLRYLDLKIFELEWTKNRDSPPP